MRLCRKTKSAAIVEIAQRDFRPFKAKLRSGPGREHSAIASTENCDDDDGMGLRVAQLATLWIMYDSSSTP